MEEWRIIPGLDGSYEASNLGRIRKTATKRVLKLCRHASGYLKVTLSVNNTPSTHLVHRLVASAFLKPEEGKTEVNHKDEDPANNHIENLEYCSHSYNINYGTRNERTSESNKGKKRSLETRRRVSAAKSKAVRMIDRDSMKTLMTFESATKAAQYCGSNDNSKICDTCNGKRKSAFGYLWEYIPA